MVYAKSASAVAPPLSAAAVERFARDGFLHMPGFVSVPVIEHLRDRLENLFARFDELPETHRRDLDESPRAPGEPPRNPEVTQCLKLEPALAEGGYVDRVRAAASQLLAGPAELGYDHAIRKPPKLGSGTAWHQDRAYDKATHLFDRLSFWLPLQPVERDQGCLRFIPASHRRGLLAHRALVDKPGAHTLTTDVAAERETIVDCPMQLGDLIVHHPLTLHCAGPNTTPRPRLAWVLIFQTPRRRERSLWDKMLRR